MRVSPVSRAAGVSLAVVLSAVAMITADAKSDGSVDARARAEVIDYVLDGLNRSYVFPAVAAKMSDAVRARVTNGEYDAITGAREFADRLTADLQAVSRDKHLRVRVAGEGRQMRMRGPTTGAGANDDGGFARVEQLPGNIGYIDLRMFHPPAIAAEQAANAMNRVADSDALIIDLRKNGGGSADMVALLVSYLLGPERVLVNTFFDRDGKLQNETWTTPDLPGRRFTGKDVYVLTSSYTFSAAEEFAYDVKNLKRATLVGETTGGGANPVNIMRINDRFEVSIPVGRAVNPITKTNWEGVGVEPDVSVPAQTALETAHVAALKNKLARSHDAETRRKLGELIAQIEGQTAA